MMKSSCTAQLLDAPRHGVYFVRLLGDGLEFGVEVHQSVLQAKILVAILFQKFGAIVKGKAAIARRQDARRKIAQCSRTLADACEHIR